MNILDNTSVLNNINSLVITNLPIRNFQYYYFLL